MPSYCQTFNINALSINEHYYYCTYIYISLLILSIIVETDSSAATADSTTAQGKKMKLKKSLKKAGAKNSDDVDFEDLFGPDPEEEGDTG